MIEVTHVSLFLKTLGTAALLFLFSSCTSVASPDAIVLAANGDSSSSFPSGLRPIGSPCAGKSGVAPYIYRLPKQYPRIGSTFVMPLQFYGLKPEGGVSRNAWLLYSTSQTGNVFGMLLPVDLGMIGMPGCVLQVPLEHIIYLPVSGREGPIGFRQPGADTGHLMLHIPNNPGLIGQTWYVQLVVSAPGENMAGYLLSQAWSLSLGS